MEAIVLGDGKISASRSLVKSASAMFSIASGGSIGREGPMVQLSSLIASLIGRMRNWSTPRMRLLVGCGAAAGIASAYNAPIAGALFVAEVVMASLAMEIFGPLVFASVIATLTVRGFLGRDPLYGVATFRLSSNWEIIPHVLLGLLAGFFGPWFLRLLELGEQLFLRLRAPVFVRMTIGGFVVGALAVGYPEVAGNGYSTISGILSNQWLWQSLALILLFKVIATGATFGSGAVGGVFTPTLFVGACLGYLFGSAVAALGPLHPNPSAFALVGMGAFLSATTHAPIMAILMIFEMTLDYEIILPLMLACVTAYYTSFSIEKRSIYSESLRRKGAGEFRSRLGELHVREVMTPNPITVSPTARFGEIGEKFIANRFNYLYVADDGRFVGAISLHDIKNFLNTPELAKLVIARDIMRERFPKVQPEATLSQALTAFAQHDGERLPVVEDSRTDRLIGTVSKTDVILTLAGQEWKMAASGGNQ
jgi:CIC family chloride channel protein